MAARLLLLFVSQRGLSNRHYGFCKAKSTIDAINLVTDLAEHAICKNDNNSKYCVVVTLEMTGRFNLTTWGFLWWFLTKSKNRFEHTELYSRDGFSAVKVWLEIAGLAFAEEKTETGPDSQAS